MSYGFSVACCKLSGPLGRYVPLAPAGGASVNPGRVRCGRRESRSVSAVYQRAGAVDDLYRAAAHGAIQGDDQGVHPSHTCATYSRPGNHRTVDGYMMAFRLVSASDPPHAGNARAACLYIQSVMASSPAHFRARAWPELHTGAGVGGGRINVGNMGSENQRAEAVETASRRKASNKWHGVGMITVRPSCGLTPDLVVRELDRIRAKGNSEPIVLWQAIGLAAMVYRNRSRERSLWQQGRKLHGWQRRDVARLQRPDSPRRDASTILWPTSLERVLHFREQPPRSDRDDTWPFETK